MNKVVIKGVAVGLAFAIAMGVAYKGDVFKSKADKFTKTNVEVTSGETEGKIYDYEVIPMNTRDRRSKLKINLDDIARESIDNCKDKLIERLQNVSHSVNENNIDDVLDDVMSDVSYDVDVSSTIDDAFQTGEIPTGSEIELDIEDATSESDGKGQKYEINDELNVTFFDNGMLSITYLSEEEEQDVDDLIDEDKETNEIYRETDEYQDEEDDNSRNITRGGKGNKSKVKSARSRTYDPLIDKIFGNSAGTIGESYIKAEFTYNKAEKKCTARRIDYYSKKGKSGVIATEIYDKYGEVLKPSKSKRVAYQKAMCAIGFTYKGVGITLDDKYIKASLVCDSNGKIVDESVCR